MRTQFKYLFIGLVCCLAVMLFAQQSDSPNLVSVVPKVPADAIAAAKAGVCISTVSGYLELNGKTSSFTDEEFGKMIQPALRQGYVLTIYPPTKRGIWTYQECVPATK